jgi:hypothetical protein
VAASEDEEDDSAAAFVTHQPTGIVQNLHTCSQLAAQSSPVDTINFIVSHQPPPSNPSNRGKLHRPSRRGKLTTSRPISAINSRTPAPRLSHPSESPRKRTKTNDHVAPEPETQHAQQNSVNSTSTYISPNDVSFRHRGYVIIDVRSEAHVMNSIIHHEIKNTYSTTTKYTFTLLVDECVEKLTAHDQNLASGHQDQSRPKCLLVHARKRGRSPWDWPAHDANTPCRKSTNSQCLKVVDKNTLWLLNPSPDDWHAQAAYDMTNQLAAASDTLMNSDNRPTTPPMGVHIPSLAPEPTTQSAKEVNHRQNVAAATLQHTPIEKVEDAGLCDEPTAILHDDPAVVPSRRPDRHVDAARELQPVSDKPESGKNDHETECAHMPEALNEALKFAHKIHVNTNDISLRRKFEDVDILGLYNKMRNKVDQWTSENDHSKTDTLIRFTGSITATAKAILEKPGWDRSRELRYIQGRVLPNLVRMLYTSLTYHLLVAGPFERLSFEQLEESRKITMAITFLSLKITDKIGRLRPLISMTSRVKTASKIIEQAQRELATTQIAARNASRREAQQARQQAEDLEEENEARLRARKEHWRSLHDRRLGAELEGRIFLDPGKDRHLKLIPLENKYTGSPSWGSDQIRALSDGLEQFAGKLLPS